jgi:peptide/nickel transport system permease protein
MSLTTASTAPKRKEENKTWQRFKKHRLAMFSMLVLGLLFFVSIFAPLIAPFSPTLNQTSNTWAQPGGQHLMGTDDLGRDVFSQLLYAGRVSLLIGVAVALLSALIGVTLGTIAGYFSGQPIVFSVGLRSSLLSEQQRLDGSSFWLKNGFRWLVWAAVIAFTLLVTSQFASTYSGIGVVIAWLVGVGLALTIAYFAFIEAIVVDIDNIISRFIDVMLSLPQIPFLLILSGLLANPDVKLGGVLDSIFGQARPIVLIIFVLVLFGWLGTARVIRGLVLSLRQREFTDAARALGSSDWRVMIRHILPNAVAPIIVQVTLDVGNNIISESALSFLGYGIPRDIPSWGNMLSSAQEAIFQNPLASFWPGLFILLTSLSINFLGDGLRDALDPRSRL